MVPDMAGIFGGFPFTPSEDGTLVFRSPRWGGKEDVPFIAMRDDFGDIVHGTLLEPEKWNGRFVQGVSDTESLDDAVKAFEKGKSLSRLYLRIARLIWCSYEQEGTFRSYTQVAGSRNVRCPCYRDREVDVRILSGIWWKVLRRRDRSKYCGRPEEESCGSWWEV